MGQTNNTIKKKLRNKEENMKNKKIIISFIVLVIAIFLIGYFSIRYVKEKKSKEEISEYTPQEEISEEQARETIVTLYFLDSESNTLKPEARLVSVKDVITSPYNTIIELLINGPKNEKLKKLIPDNTQLLNTSLEKECLTVDFSNELLNYNKNNQNEKENMVKSIVNTLTELTEVNKVKILINGQVNEEFKDEYVRK